jgi:predicted acyltransferase (DUF342 family)
MTNSYNLKTKEEEKMKTQKLLVIAAIVCLLVGALAGAAMAELNDCSNGVLKDEVFNNDLRITGNEPCVIIGCTIQGDIRATNLPYILLLNNKVTGIIRVDGNAGIGVANVIANTVLGEKIVVRDNDTAYVLENDAVTGDIRVNFNTKAFVQKNIAAQDITCRENTDLTGSLNLAGGNNTCN